MHPCELLRPPSMRIEAQSARVLGSAPHTRARALAFALAQPYACTCTHLRSRVERQARRRSTANGGGAEYAQNARLHLHAYLRSILRIELKNCFASNLVSTHLTAEGSVRTRKLTIWALVVETTVFEY